jgi:hypothetical protein
MDAASKFFFEQIVDEPVTLDTRFSGKRIGNNKNSKVALAGTRGIPMSCVHLGFIDDVEPGGPQPDHELFPQATCNGHLFLSWISFVPLWCDAVHGRKGLLMD